MQSGQLLKLREMTESLVQKFIKKLIESLDRILEKIAPMKQNRDYEKKLNEKINNLGSLEDARIDEYPFEYVIVSKDEKDTELMDNTYKESMARQKTFEDKAKTNLLAISISVTIMFGLIRIIVNIYDKVPIIWVKFILYFISLLVVAYMMFGGILALKVLMEKNIIYKMTLDNLKLEGEELVREYKKNIELNELSNTIRNNYISTSYDCIRNALVILCFIFALGILPVGDSTNEIQGINEKITSMTEDVDELRSELYETQRTTEIDVKIEHNQEIENKIELIRKEIKKLNSEIEKLEETYSNQITELQNKHESEIVDLNIK